MLPPLNLGSAATCAHPVFCHPTNTSFLTILWPVLTAATPHTGSTWPVPFDSGGMGLVVTMTSKVNGNRGVRIFWHAVRSLVYSHVPMYWGYAAKCQRRPEWSRGRRRRREGNGGAFPPQPYRDLGERFILPSEVRGRASSENSFDAY